MYALPYRFRLIYHAIDSTLLPLHCGNTRYIYTFQRYKGVTVIVEPWHDTHKQQRNGHDHKRQCHPLFVATGKDNAQQCHEQRRHKSIDTHKGIARSYPHDKQCHAEQVAGTPVRPHSQKREDRGNKCHIIISGHLQVEEPISELGIRGDKRDNRHKCQKRTGRRYLEHLADKQVYNEQQRHVHRCTKNRIIEELVQETANVGEHARRHRHHRIEICSVKEEEREGLGPLQQSRLIEGKQCPQYDKETGHNVLLRLRQSDGQKRRGRNAALLLSRRTLSGGFIHSYILWFYFVPRSHCATERETLGPMFTRTSCPLPLRAYNGRARPVQPWPRLPEPHAAPRTGHDAHARAGQSPRRRA